MGRPKLAEPNFRLARKRNGVYAIFYTDPQTGRTRSVSTGARDRAEAEAERQR